MTSEIAKSNSVEQEKFSIEKQVVMRDELRPLPVALRCQTLSDGCLDALHRVSKDSNPTIGVLDWVPRRVTHRGRVLA